MSWLRSHLFWKIVGLYALLSILSLAGLLATLTSQLQEQSENLHRDHAAGLAERFVKELEANSTSEVETATVRRWQDSLSTIDYRLWLVDESGKSVSVERQPVPDRAVIQSAARTAARLGTSVRWMRDSSDGQKILIVARVCRSTSGSPRVAMLLSDMANLADDHQLIAAAASRGAVFTWLIGVLCVVFIAIGLVGPLQVMTENLGTAVARNQRQDMLMRISDRHDELGDVAQSLTELEVDREDRIEALEEAERQSRSAVELLSAVLDSMIEGVIAVDNLERILFLNAAARRLLTIGDVIGVGNRLYEAVRLPAVLETINESLKTNRMQSLEFRTTREGLFLAMVVNPIRKGPQAGAVVVIRDVSELRRLEAMRRDFVSGVSHELKTPLTVIQACTDTLLEGALDDREVAHRFLKQIEEQSERLLQLILGMLQLARVESGTEVFRFEPVSLQSVVAEVLRSLGPVAESRNVRLHQEGLPELVVVADEQALRTIVSNLLDNAIKHTPSEGHVTLLLSYESGCPVLAVRDTGTGIAKEHLPRIFERFYRVDRDRSRERGGTGLGLAIVKHLCHTMKASVSVRSEPGRGTEFRVVFRRESQPAGSSSSIAHAVP